MLGIFFYPFIVSCSFFFKINYFFRNILYCQYKTIWIQNRTRILSDLIWVQTVGKGCKQSLLARKLQRNCILLKWHNNLFCHCGLKKNLWTSVYMAVYRYLSLSKFQFPFLWACIYSFKGLD